MSTQVSHSTDGAARSWDWRSKVVLVFVASAVLAVGAPKLAFLALIVFLPGAAAFVLSYPFLLVLAQVRIARSLMVVPEGDVPCARCQSQPRTASGCCAPCSSLLASSPLPFDHPASRFVRALDGGDHRTLRECVAPTITMRGLNGHAVPRSRARWMRRVRFNRWAFGRQTGSVLAAQLDLSNREYVWVRTHERAAGRLIVPAFDTRLLMRYWMPHEQVVEIQVFAPLGGR